MFHSFHHRDASRVESYQDRLYKAISYQLVAINYSAKVTASSRCMLHCEFWIHLIGLCKSNCELWTLIPLSRVSFSFALYCSSQLRVLDTKSTTTDNEPNNRVSFPPKSLYLELAFCLPSPLSSPQKHPKLALRIFLPRF